MTDYFSPPILTFISPNKCLKLAPILFTLILKLEILQAGIKCKVAQLQDWLDIQCITFRTESSRNRNKVNKEQGSEVGNKRDRKKRKKESEDVLAGSDAVHARPRMGRKLQ